MVQAVELPTDSEAVSFLTPYWSGPGMMRIHLASIRRFHPAAPILVSKRGGGDSEMQAYRSEFGLRYWIEDCDYFDAYLRLLERCETRYACILDHDVVLLGGLAPLLRGLAEDRFDLVGIEERILAPGGAESLRLYPASNGWMRFSPGSVAANFLLFDWREFRARWGLRGVAGTRGRGAKDFESDYGVGQKLPRHKYLRPYHAPRYGMGNLLKDGETAVLWHQWYGSYRTRLQPGAAYPDESALYPDAERGERAFLADYPALDFSGLAPAWGPERDLDAERRIFTEQRRFTPRRFAARGLRMLRRWHEYGARGILARSSAWLDRRRRLR